MLQVVSLNWTNIPIWSHRCVIFVSGLDIQSLEALQAYAILLSAESEISAMTDPKSKIFPLKEVCQLPQSPVSQSHESQESVLHQKCVPKSPQISQTVCVHSGTTLHNLDKKVLMKSSPESNERTDLKRAAMSPELSKLFVLTSIHCSMSRHISCRK